MEGKKETDPVFMEYALKRSLLSRNKLAIILKEPEGVTKFCCVECPSRFEEKGKLEVHLLTHNKEYRHICDICGTGLKRREHLDRHKLGHQELRPYVCPECGKGFKRKEHLTIHRSIHSGDKSQVCTLCNRSFNRKDHLQKHLQTHTKMFFEQNMNITDEQNLTDEQEMIEIKQEPINVTMEEEDNIDYSELSESMDYDPEAHDPLDTSGSCGADAGGDPARPHACGVCLKTFKRREHLRMHSWTHMKKDKECPSCGKAFQEVQLFAHMMVCEKMQQSGENELTDMDALSIENDSNMDGSNSCGSNSESLGEVRTADAHAARPHVCPVCFKSYKRRDHLKIHSWTHKEKDKICDACGKAFHMKEQLSWHMSVCMAAHLNNTADHDTSVTSESSLLVERKIVAGAESRPHACPVCARRFKRKQHLKVHAKVHLRAAPQNAIWCSVCQEGFLSNEQFESHRCTPAEEDTHADEAGASPPPDARKENSNPSEFLEQQMIEEESTVEQPAYSPQEKYSPQIQAEQAEARLPVPQRVYVCKYCLKPFKRKDHYNIHLHIHTGVKSFFCTDCGKGFYRKDHLQKHTQVHSKMKLKPKKQLPDLFPINKLPKKKEIKPEITIHAPSNTKLRVPLQIKVPYQMVVPGGRTVTVDPKDPTPHDIFT